MHISLMDRLGLGVIGEIDLEESTQNFVDLFPKVYYNIGKEKERR